MKQRLSSCDGPAFSSQRLRLRLLTNKTEQRKGTGSAQCRYESLIQDTRGRKLLALVIDVKQSLDRDTVIENAKGDCDETRNAANKSEPDEGDASEEHPAIDLRYFGQEPAGNPEIVKSRCTLKSRVGGEGKAKQAPQKASLSASKVLDSAASTPSTMSSNTGQNVRAKCRHGHHESLTTTSYFSIMIRSPIGTKAQRALRTSCNARK